MVLQTSSEKSSRNFAMERTLWERDHGVLSSIHSLARSKEYASKILRPEKDLEDARSSELHTRVFDHVRGLTTEKETAIMDHVEAQAVLQCVEHSRYDRADEIVVSIKNERKPVLGCDPLLLQHAFPLPRGAFEPEPDASSADDDDKDVFDGEHTQQAEGEQRAEQTEEARLAAADLKHGRKTRRSVYPGGRYNYEGYPRGTLYRDVKLPRPAFEFGLADILHGGLLYWDLRHTRAPGPPLIACSPVPLFLSHSVVHSHACAVCHEVRCLRAHVLPQLGRTERSQPASVARLYRELAWRVDRLCELEPVPRAGARRPHAQRQAPHVAGEGRPADGRRGDRAAASGGAGGGCGGCGCGGCGGGWGRR